MSWATIAQKAKDTTPTSTEPKRVVFAPVGSSNNDDDDGDNNPWSRFENIHSSTSAALPAYTKGLLVLDANAFIKGMDNFNDVADALLTTSQVVAEVRDRAARNLLQRLPHALHVMEPSKDALAAVVAVAEKTGDLGAMSRTDIRLCALALDCCRATQSLLAPIEPRPAKINPGGEHGTAIMTEVMTDDDDDNDEEDADANGVEEQEMGEEQQPESSFNNNNNTNTNNNEEEEEDEAGWITPENIHQCAPDGAKVAGERFDGGVACVTSDYAMQNTLLHLGVPIVGPQGMRIRELRHWLLRCTSCFAVTTDTTRQFCGACGSGDTLRRVQYVVTRDGERQLFINFRKAISTRGTVYNLPKPRGGKRGTNRSLVLREDQLAHVIRGTTSAKLKAKHVVHGGRGDDDDLAAFGEAPKQHKRDPNQPRVFSSYHKYNVNEKKKARASRRK
ncbi:RNA-binding protein NOB1 [Trypanosoma grayi]|uniref:RNA-binding protein NOB1 n=1 Tax=Trypanosoma grayi TaxID=71804 RepID=UPI0004F42494|nr:RNA-binding protein NOB1 [Trypanosoma grayi]KEG09159.1 RNA-binding protein NOB1 [Trypanosoma grayi]